MGLPRLNPKPTANVSSISTRLGCSSNIDDSVQSIGLYLSTLSQSDLGEWAARNPVQLNFENNGGFRDDPMKTIHK